MLDVKQLLGELVQSVKQAEFKRAATQLATIIEHKPDLYEDWLGVSRLALLAGEVELARESLKLFKKRVNSKLNVDMAYFAALVEVGEFKSAVEKAEGLFKDNQNSPEVSHFLSTVYLQMGQGERAAEYARTTLSRWPLAGETWLVLVHATQVELSSDTFKKMLSLEEQFARNSSSRSTSAYYAALSKIYESNNNVNLAFDYASKSKLASDPKMSDEFKLDDKRVNNIIENAHLESSSQQQVVSCSSQNPIFIVGLPRSGTTLLEQILCSHSQVLDGGEFNGMERAARIITKGQALGEFSRHFSVDEDVVEQIRTVYLQYAHQRFGNTGIIVDKSLNNNRYVWLIRKVFPASPIVFMTRNPLDSAWSCFKTHFSQGLRWSSNLEGIARYFTFEYRLYEHWFAQQDSRLFKLNYEDLVNETEQEIKKLTDFCGLQFEASMLNFYQNNRVILTASVTQARQKMYSSSISAGALDNLMKPFSDNFMQIK